jgi:hypothetical protein
MTHTVYFSHQGKVEKYSGESSSPLAKALHSALTLKRQHTYLRERRS